jgi:hypothetical protein
VLVTIDYKKDFSKITFNSGNYLPVNAQSGQKSPETGLSRTGQVPDYIGL